MVISLFVDMWLPYQMRPFASVQPDGLSVNVILGFG
jgi:hypothetical protein